MLRGLLVAAAAMLALTGFPTEDDATTPTTAEALTDAALLTADEVPARDRLTAWRDDGGAHHRRSGARRLLSRT
ncbi:MAG: hypothetical protein H0X12_16510 [Nocardioides sp.]|nr:hypothetical protein [Nocardioides sp.]